MKTKRMLLTIFTVTLLFYYGESSIINENQVPKTCDHQIYCYGNLLHQIQLAGIYNDSKTFVDKSLRFCPEQVLTNFNNLKLNFNGGQIPKINLTTFVHENFQDTHLIQKWRPTDWKPNPSYIDSIADKKLQKWAWDLNEIWLNLSRKYSEDVKLNAGKHSLIYVPNGFIVPGGRFNEIYYWDTLWIVNGLLISSMWQTAKGVIENLLHLVNTMGHVPNGNRLYYVERSQPPVLTLMVDAYYKATKDWKFIKENINILDKEMDFWNSDRMIQVKVDRKKYNMYRYHAVSSGPRPESYLEDWKSVQYYKDETSKLNHYIELKSGAESGWDFSSRWFPIDKKNASLVNIQTSHIIPVDLNSILQLCFSKLGEWYDLLGNDMKSKQYKHLAKQLQIAINSVFWHEKDGIWYDYDLTMKKNNRQFYMSNFAPLWTKSYDFPKYYLSQKIYNYIVSNNLLRYPGGTPTSLKFTKQQWDYPNAWPPLQAFLIQGLDKIGIKKTSIVAFQLASNWINSNFNGYHKYSRMFEKYDARSIGETGEGGEYEAQFGFGWTNGLAMEFLNQWGTQLQADI